MRDGEKVIYRPTCHYAYHPANDAVLSLHEMFGATGKMQPSWHILDENEIEDGIDELGVLVYGHAKNAYWYGSQLSIEETRRIAPYQNATGMQVSSAVLAGMVWALENPKAGIVEADEMDFRRCLEIQMPYLGPVKGFYTDWTPLTDRPGLFPEDIDTQRSLAVQERAGAVTAPALTKISVSASQQSKASAARLPLREAAGLRRSRTWRDGRRPARNLEIPSLGVLDAPPSRGMTAEAMAAAPTSPDNRTPRCPAPASGPP